jgi:hypothetical protein
MRRTLTTAARASATVWSDVVRNPDLRRLELGRVWSVTAESIAAVCLAVYGFTTSGSVVPRSTADARLRELAELGTSTPAR